MPGFACTHGCQRNEIRWIKTPGKEWAMSRKTTQFRKVCGKKKTKKHENKHGRGPGVTVKGMPRERNRDGGAFWYAASVKAGMWRPLCVFNIQTCRNCLWSTDCINVCMNKQLWEVERLLEPLYSHAFIQRINADWLTVWYLSKVPLEILSVFYIKDN